MGELETLILGLSFSDVVGGAILVLGQVVGALVMMFGVRKLVKTIYRV